MVTIKKLRLFLEKQLLGKHDYEYEDYADMLDNLEFVLPYAHENLPSPIISAFITNNKPICYLFNMKDIKILFGKDLWDTMIKHHENDSDWAKTGVKEIAGKLAKDVAKRGFGIIALQ